jgi:hypothetical protein
MMIHRTRRMLTGPIGIRPALSDMLISCASLALALLLCVASVHLFELLASFSAVTHAFSASPPMVWTRSVMHGFIQASRTAPEESIMSKDLVHG